MVKSKKNIFLCFSFALFLIFTLCLFSCTTPETEEENELEIEWNEIKDSGSIEDLLDFAANLDRTAHSRIYDEANQKISDKIEKEENLETLNLLLNKYPERKDEFKKKISEISLKYALEENTVEALEKYVAEFKDYIKNDQNEDYINQAKEAIKYIYFNEAKDQKSIELLGQFIRKYEDEDFEAVAAAASLIDDIRWENAQKGGTYDDYHNFIDASVNYGFYSKYIDEANKKISELEWHLFYEMFQNDKTISILQTYIEHNPDSLYISEAERLIEEMRNDSSYSEKYLKKPTLDLIDEFVLKFPGHKDIEKAMQLREYFIGDLYSMIQKGYISAAISGRNITQSRVIIQNRTDAKLEVTIPFGTYFTANSGNVQNMLVREEVVLSINAGRRRSIYINTACMNMYKDIPDSTVYFTVNMLQEDSLLIKLLKTLEKNNSSFEVAQAAIYHIMDNPGKTAILESLAYEDEETGEREWAISLQDYNEALRMIEIAAK